MQIINVKETELGVLKIIEDDLDLGLSTAYEFDYNVFTVMWNKGFNNRSIFYRMFHIRKMFCKVNIIDDNVGIIIYDKNFLSKAEEIGQKLEKELKVECMILIKPKSTKYYFSTLPPM